MWWSSRVAIRPGNYGPSVGATSMGQLGKAGNFCYTQSLWQTALSESNYEGQLSDMTVYVGGGTSWGRTGNLRWALL